MIRAIFSDFNGVIVDDERLQMEAYQQVLRPRGVELTEEQYFSSLGMDDKSFVRAAFKRTSTNLTEDLMTALIDEKSDCHRNLIKDHLPLFPGVVTFLKAASRHFSLGLVSMARRIEIEHILDRARLDNLFSVIVSAENVNACKPATDCYRLALQALNSKRREQRQLPLLAKECLVIEDSPPGIESGRGAGMRTLGVTNTVAEAELRNAGADVVTASLADWTVDALRLVF
jgi:beta-phosphoglucomutase